MRQEIIDLSGEQRVGHGTRYIGTVGEHNATELVLTVPPEMLKAAEYVVVLFDVGDTVFRSVKIPVKGRKKTPPAWIASGAVHCFIDHKVSSHPRVALQVEGWRIGANGRPECVMKSPLVTGLAFRPSAAGCSTIPLAAEGTHEHSNLDVLERFGATEDDKPTFDGVELSQIGGGDYSAIEAEVRRLAASMLTRPMLMDILRTCQLVDGVLTVDLDTGCAEMTEDGSLVLDEAVCRNNDGILEVLIWA